MNVAVAVLLALQLVNPAACDVTRRQLLPIFADLFEVSNTAAHDTERALFLTRNSAGELDSQLWPATYQRRKASFEGAVPMNTIAIAHTHPHGMPKPSQHDLEEAARTGLPIYVVTRTSIMRAEPNRTTTELVAQKDWYDVAKGNGDVCEVWS